MVKYKEFKIKELFDIHPTKSYGLTNDKLFNSNGNVPVIVNSSTNNGIRGYVNKEPTEKGNIITFSDTTTDETIFYQPNDFIGYSHIQGVYPIEQNKWSKNSLLYFLTLFKKCAKGRFDYATKFNRTIALEMKIKLPITDRGEINYKYMEERIRELEEERIRELEEYLKVSGLDNYNLTEKEQATLNKYKNNQIKYQQFKIGDLFDKLDLKRLNKNKFNKDKDLSKEFSKEYNLPLVNAKNGDNGIMYYARSSDYESAEMTIDIVNDGAVSTGNVYAQPQKTGVLYNAYLIKPKYNKITTEILLFLTTALQKSIKLKFAYDNKASWNKVKLEYINLPVNDNNEIDYNFMENFIKAQEKLIIQNLSQWRKKEIDITKQIINS